MNSRKLIKQVGDTVGEQKIGKYVILIYIFKILILLTNMWWPEVELNHRHTDFQSVALPTELSGPLEKGLSGITRKFYAALRKGRYGAVGETRTPTQFPAHEPESCVSTNSTTTAY